ncbi:MAG: hypothetical protein ACPGU7_01420 [Gammaproteobacteria bacterium]
MMNRSALILFPQQAPPSASAVQLESRLRALGLIGHAFAFEGQQHFEAGEAFLEWIMFLGCIPHLVLDVEEGLRDESHAFIHLELRDGTGCGQWVMGRNTLAPRCPSCRKPHRGWREQHVADGAQVLVCPFCAVEAAVDAWNWKHSAGPGGLSIWIWGVFPSEGIASPALLKELDALGWGAWDHFYWQS